METGKRILHFQSTGLVEGKTQPRCHVVHCACQPTQRTPPQRETPPGKKGLSQKPGDPLCLLSQTLVHMPQAQPLTQLTKVQPLHRQSHNCITWAQVPDKYVSLIWWLFIIQ